MASTTLQNEISNDKAYGKLLAELKEKVRSAQVKAALSVNKHLVLLYWEIGNNIIQEQNKQGWGAKVIERLAVDLKKEFPDMKGFSLRNLIFMRQFAEEYQDSKIVKQLVSQLPWEHNILLIQQIKEVNKRLWYIQQTIENSWSRNVLSLQIKSKLYERQAKVEPGKVTNFANFTNSVTTTIAI